VDDITHELSISKKTFYENFANKSDLINQITMGFLRKIDKVLDDIEKSGRALLTKSLHYTLSY